MAGPIYGFNADNTRRIVRAVRKSEREPPPPTNQRTRQRPIWTPWKAFKNTSSETVPAYGIIAITGREFPSEHAPSVLTGTKPSDTLYREYRINSSLPVEPDGYGSCMSLGLEAEVLYNTEDDPPEPGEVWGAVPDQWYAGKGYPGLTIVGGKTGAGVLSRVTAYSELISTLTAKAISGSIPRRDGNKPGRGLCQVVTQTRDGSGDLVLTELEDVTVRANNLQPKPLVDEYFSLIPGTDEKWIAIGSCCPVPAADCASCGDEITEKKFWLEIAGLANDECDSCDVYNCAFPLTYRTSSSSEDSELCAWIYTFRRSVCMPECPVSTTDEDDDTASESGCHPAAVLWFYVQYFPGADETHVGGLLYQSGQSGDKLLIFENVGAGQVDCLDLCDLELTVTGSDLCDTSGVTVTLRCAEPATVCDAGEDADDDYEDPDGSTDPPAFGATGFQCTGGVWVQVGADCLDQPGGTTVPGSVSPDPPGDGTCTAGQEGQTVYLTCSDEPYDPGTLEEVDGDELPCGEITWHCYEPDWTPIGTCGNPNCSPHIGPTAPCTEENDYDLHFPDEGTYAVLPCQFGDPPTGITPGSCFSWACAHIGNGSSWGRIDNTLFVCPAASCFCGQPAAVPFYGNLQFTACTGAVV